MGVKVGGQSIDTTKNVNVDVQDWAGTALGAPTIWGVTPTGEEVIGVNAYCVQGTSPWVVSLTSTTITGTVAVTQSGLWTVQQGGAPWTFVGALTNNNAAPAATNIGVLPAIAETAYNTITYTTGDQVLPVTDLHGALNQDLQAVAGVALGATAVVPYGSTPAGVNVPAVNAFITNSPAVTVSGTVAVTQSTSPWVVSLASTTITGTVTTQGNLTNNNAVPNAFNLGVLPAIAEGTYTTLAYTSGDQVLPATDSHGALWSDLAAVAGVALGATAVTAFGSAPAAVNVPAVNASLFSGTTPLTNTGGALNVNVTNPTSSTVAGSLTNNNAAPIANNMGVLGFIAETAYATTTYTTGNQVLAVTDLHGAVNTDWQALAGTALGGPTTWGTAPTAEQVQGVNAFCIQGTSPWVVSLASTTITGTVAVTQSTSPWVVSLASTTITGTVAVTQSGTWTVQQGGAPWSFQGNLTNNNAAPNAFNVGVLPAIAETAYNTVTYTTGDMVLPVTDLHGALNSDIQAWGGTQITNVPTAIGTGTPAGNAPAVNAAAYVGTTPVRSNQTTTATGVVDINVAGIIGVTAVAAASGVLKVGISGAAAATLDSTIGAATAPTNALATSVVYQTTIPALTAGQAVAQQCDTTGATLVNTEVRKKTYSTSASFTGAAGVIAVLPGNASTTVRVLRVEVSIYTTGTAAIEVISLIKTSAAPTGGTSASITIVPHDSGFAGASSVPLNYTVAPTAGTPVGTIRSVAFADSSGSALPGANTWLWDWTMRAGSAPVLRGTAQTLEINLGGAVATQTCIVSFEWTEDNP
jgi:hypothetical protein